MSQNPCKHRCRRCGSLFIRFNRHVPFATLKTSPLIVLYVRRRVILLLRFTFTNISNPNQVSSFNLPAHYDSTLITPVTMSESTSMATKSSPSMSKEKPIKLSPTSGSPTFHLFEDDDFGSSRYNQPMKHKTSSPSDSAFPVSPYVCPEPFWGSFGVSATPGSGQTATSSPPMHHSPNLNSAGSTSTESRRSRQPTPTQNTSSYGAHTVAPILIAPNPSDLRGSVKQESDIYRRHNSLQSNHSTPRSQGASQGGYIDSMTTLSSSGKKRKTPEAGLEGDVLLSSDLTFEEHLLLQLTEQEQLPWKEVALRFNEKTGKMMKVPALQMRKKRLIERLRVWTDTEVVRIHSARCSPLPAMHASFANALAGAGSDHRMGRVREVEMGNHRQAHAQTWLY